MTRYIIRRFLLMIPTLLIVSMIVFSLIRLIPGDIAEIMVENRRYASDVDELREKLGLNQPLPVQYVKWLGGLLTGDWGTSLWTGRTISEELRYRIPLTLQLGIMTMTISLVVAIPIGVLSAIRQDSAIDYLTRSLAILGLAMPAFWMATILLVFGSIWFGWAPRQWVPFSANPWGSIMALLIPAIILGVDRAASLMRMTRAMMLETLRQDYIRTAWSKGLRERVVVTRHALRNAFIPVITLLGLQIPAILGGSVVIETIFNLPGTGKFLLDAIEARDYPMVQIMNMIFASFILLTTLAVDLAYGYLDPRIRYN
ncbi:MAG: ABC transporter permease [Dehalococcoidia bacterium]